MNMIKTNDKVPKLFGNWDELSKKLQHQYSNLTTDDLVFEEGKENDMIRRIEVRLNITHDDVIDIIKATQRDNY